MTITVSAGPLLALDAPLPRPRTDDLLAVADIVEHDTDDRWLGGIWTGGSVPGPAHIHDPCEQGTDRIKEPGGEIGSRESSRFVVYLPVECTAQSIAPNLDEWIDRLERAFIVYERAAVERAFREQINDENLEVLADAAVDPLTALRLLENAVAKNGTGIIHAAPSTVVAWDALNLTVLRDDLTFTKRGTPVAVGAGYVSESASQWAFASGPLEVHRARDIDVPTRQLAEIMDRSMNDIYVLAERPYAFNWLGRSDTDDDSHTQAGVLIDESLTYSLVTVDGGSCSP